MPAYVSATDLLRGIELLELPSGYTPLEAVVLIKALDEDGDVQWLTRYSKDIHMMEALGALHAALTLATRDMVTVYTPEEEGED